MEIKNTQIEELFTYYSSYESLPYSRLDDPQLQLIQDRCNSLFSRDYMITLLRNNNGELCPTYPPQIILVMGYLDLCAGESGTQQCHTPKSQVEIIQGQMENSKDCRTRSRFPVPVININGKNICRSAGLVEKSRNDV